MVSQYMEELACSATGNVANIAQRPTAFEMAETVAEPHLKRRTALVAVVQYGIAVVCVAIALGASLAAQHYGFRDVALPVLALSIAVTSWHAGPGPSVLAIGLCTASFSYFFMEPIYSFEISSRELPYLLVFVAWAVMAGPFAAVRRRIEEARDRLQVEVKRRAQQARLLDQTHDSIIFRQLDGRITYWNRGAQELYGWSADEAIGKSSHELLRAIFPAPLQDIDQELLRMGVWEGELEHTRSDGAKVIVASRWSLSRDDAGQPIVMETNNDITERKRREGEVRKLNQELAQRAAELDASNKELESFAYSVSHDLRAPLRHMAAYSELLQKQAPRRSMTRAAGTCKTILDASKRMGNLIDDLLAFSRIGRAEAQKDQGEP